MYKYNEIIKSGVIYYGELEYRFIERVLKEKNISIKIFDFGFMKDRPLNLLIYVENKNTTTQVNKLLIDNAMPSMMGHYIHSYHSTHMNELANLSDEIIDIFLDVYNYCVDGFPSISIRIYRFELSAVSSISSFANDEMVDMLSIKIPDRKFKLLNRGDLRFYLVLSSDMYNKFNISKVIKKIVHKMFLIMIMHDKFGYVKEEDIELVIYDKNMVNPETIGVDPREWMY